MAKRPTHGGISQRQFDQLLFELIDDWCHRRLEGNCDECSWDELGLDCCRAIGGLVRVGQNRGLQMLSVDVTLRMKVALEQVRAGYPPQVKPKRLRIVSNDE